MDLDRLIGAYYDEHPDPSDPQQAVSFGTSGHRGSSLAATFTEDHILAISEAIARYRGARRDRRVRCSSGATRTRCRSQRSGPRSRCWSPTAIEVAVDSDDGFTPTPAISHAILTHNAHGGPRADGIVITPSHNPPEDGGFKYNPPHGGPADTGVTKQIQDTANELLRDGLSGVRRQGYDEAIETRSPLRLPLGVRR